MDRRSDLDLFLDDRLRLITTRTRNPEKGLYLLPSDEHVVFPLPLEVDAHSRRHLAVLPVNHFIIKLLTSCAILIV